MSSTLPARGPAPRCKTCQDSGTACEGHPGRPWGGVCCGAPPGQEACEYGSCHCGAPGIPCPACCSPVPQDGRHPITEAFVPDRRS